MTINKNRFSIYKICMLALLTAMMVLLKRTIAIETPYFKFSFASLPIVRGAMVFGPIEGAEVGLLGEFVAQINKIGKNQYLLTKNEIIAMSEITELFMKERMKGKAI